MKECDNWVNYTVLISNVKVYNFKSTLLLTFENARSCQSQSCYFDMFRSILNLLNERLSNQD